MNFPFASDRICTTVKWIPRALTGSHVPTALLTNAVPCGPVVVGWRAITTEPSAAKVERARPPGVSAIQVPTMGWLARSVGVASCAAVPRLLRPPRDQSDEREDDGDDDDDPTHDGLQY